MSPQRLSDDIIPFLILNPKATKGGMVFTPLYEFLHNTLIAYGIKFRHFR